MWRRSTGGRLLRVIVLIQILTNPNWHGPSVPPPACCSSIGDGRLAVSVIKACTTCTKGIRGGVINTMGALLNHRQAAIRQPLCDCTDRSGATKSWFRRARPGSAPGWLTGSSLLCSAY